MPRCFLQITMWECFPWYWQMRSLLTVFPLTFTDRIEVSRTSQDYGPAMTAIVGKDVVTMHLEPSPTMIFSLCFSLYNWCDTGGKWRLPSVLQYVANRYHLPARWIIVPLYVFILRTRQCSNKASWSSDQWGTGEATSCTDLVRVCSCSTVSDISYTDGKEGRFTDRFAEHRSTVGPYGQSLRSVVGQTPRWQPRDPDETSESASSCDNVVPMGSMKLEHGGSRFSQ